MDGVRPTRGHDRGSRPQHRPISRAHTATPPKKERHAGEKYWLVRSIGKVASKRRQTLWNKFQQTEFAKWPDKSKLHRLYAWLVLILFITTTVVGLLQPLIENTVYKVTPATRGILPQQNAHLAESLKFNAKESAFMYNEGYKPSTSANDLRAAGNGSPRFSANLSKDPSKGVKITDPSNNIDFTLTPKYRLGTGKQDKNQVMYPLGKTDGVLVYTAQIASIKEDIALQSKSKEDRLVFEYELGLGNGLEARQEKNGSIGVYGSSLPLYGNVATGSDKDAELLQKAKENASKDKFLFGIPAPVVKEAGKNGSAVSAKFELKGKSLKVIVEGLKQATYPLTIDPSVYIQSAAQLMYGNNETNVEFDVATEQFKKGTTTGARIDSWTETTDMPSSIWDQGTVTSGSYVYTAGGRTGRVKPRIVDQKSSSLSTTSGSFTMSMPDIRPAGDLYIAIIAHDVAGNNTMTAPSGWTAIQVTAREHAVYYKIGTNVSGGNEAASYQWSKAGTAVQWSGTILRVKNFAFSGSVASLISTSTTATSGNPSYPAITATDQGALLIRSASVNDVTPADSGYSPASHSDVGSGVSGGTSGVGYVVSELYDPPASGSATAAASVTSLSGAYGASSIVIYGNTASSTVSSSVQWAHFNNTTRAIESPAPGSNAVSCSGWCSNSAYDLPAAAGKVGAAMVAYNGYLYVIGGNDGTNLKSTIYIAKLGANGEPSLWHPTDSNQANWVYWYADSGLSSARAYLSAYAYNGKMYVFGGDTDAPSNTTGAINTVQIADILPNGKLGSWSSGQSLTAARYGSTVQGYNGYIYILGGNTGSAILNTTEFSRLNSDGTMNTWQSAAADGTGTGLTTARESHGGVMSGIWGGYIYIAGGCNAVNASGYCTSTVDDVQLASINADGTLDSWNTMGKIKNKRFGDSFIAWQDSLYRFGGCEYQDPSTGTCNATHISVQYGPINQDGDASTVSITKSFGDATGNCNDPDPYDCNLPDAGTAANQGGQALSSAVILNGYLYVIGGCTSDNCAAMSNHTYYAAIDSSGRLKSPPSCSGSTVGAWCVDSTNTIIPTAGTGIGAAAATVFNGTIYVIGGQNNNGGVNRIFRNTVNSDGSLAGAWQFQRFNTVGLNSYDTNGLSYTFAYARANPSSAGTNPGNLFLFGGCTSPSSGSAGCANTYSSSVYKCNIATSGAVSGCVTGAGNGQLDITQDSGATGAGLGIHAGTVYANYIYLIGGVAPGFADIPKIRYAKFDNNNNVVAASGSTWIESNVQMNHGRRRGTAFGYNGYLYAVGGYDSASGSVLDTVEFAKINVSDGSLVSSIAKSGSPGTYLFSQSAVTINQRWGLAITVSNSYAYIIGGCKSGVSPTCNTSSFDNTVQTFQVYNNDSGAPGKYTTAANLYATDRIGAGAAVLNGYLYMAGGCTSATDCTTTTTDVQKAAIDANGAVGAWTAMTGTGLLPAARGFGQLEVAGGTLYFIGGETGGTAQSTIYYATIGGSGVISAWTSTTKGIGDTGSGAQARSRFSSTVWNNRIYVTGGYNASSTAQATVYISPQLNSGGDISSNWSSTTSFNVARLGHVAIAYANNLYILAGYDGTNYLSDVQFAKLDSSTGAVSGSWTYTTSLPFGLRQADGFASNGYMYLFGGRTSTNDCTSRTLIAPISANTTIASGNNPTGIGEWYQTNRNFDGGRYGAAAVNYQGKAYVLGGGCQGVVMQDDFDATLDASQWTSTTGMTVGTVCQSTSSSNVLYMTDGASGANAAITKDMSLTSGGTLYFKLYSPTVDTGGCYKRENEGLLTTNPDDVVLQYSTNGGGAWTTLATYAWNSVYDPMKNISVTIPSLGANTRFRWYMPQGEATDSFSLDDIYVISTGNTSISYPSDRVAQTPLLSQPQVATYSRLIDAGNDAFPKKFLMNGIDNSIGARWQISYRSMNDPTNTANPCGGSVMTGYGALTNFGDVTLGTPGTYTMKNGSGTDIGCGRYFFMTISIDASQTYGYPDDISRGPTLDNLTLFYNSNPGKRLIHGKTFTEGIQQPLDTQP